MKKILATILTVAMLCTCFVGCNKKGNDDVQENELGLINPGTLTIGMEVGYPPFEKKDENGEPIGYDVDLAYALADKLGLEVKIIDTAFDVIFASIGTDYDCVISAVTITEDRKQSMIFSTPYIQNYQAVAVKKGSDIKISSLKDLSGHSVILQKGTTSQDLLDDMIATGTVTECSMTATEQILTCFTALDNGEYETVLVDSTVAADYVTANPDKYEIAYVDSEYPEEFGIAFAPSNTALQEAVNKAMAELKAEGFFEENNEKWFQETVSDSDAQ